MFDTYFDAYHEYVYCFVSDLLPLCYLIGSVLLIYGVVRWFKKKTVKSYVVWSLTLLIVPTLIFVFLGLMGQSYCRSDVDPELIPNLPTEL